MKQSTRYDGIVLEYLEKPHCTVFIVSDDELFKKNLRTTLNKTLGLKYDVLEAYDSTAAVIKPLKARLDHGYPVLIFVEGLLRGKLTTDFITTLKAQHPEAKIIALVGEGRREDVAYLYEVGANNVIAKPASVNNIIEKMAFTIRPQGKLTEIVHLTKRLLAAKQYDKVLPLCEKILKIKPGSPTGLMLKGDAFLGLGKRERALQAYLEAHENAKLFIEPLKRLAAFYHGADDDMYLQYMKKLDRLSPLHAERKRDIGEAHLAKGDMSTAEKYFDQAIECATREASAIIENMAESIAQRVQGRSPHLAEKYLSKMLDAKKGHWGRADLVTFNKLGIALKLQGKWEEAIENYRKALKIAPDDEGLYYNIGVAYFEGGRLQEAVNSFARALKINPELHKGNDRVAFNLANVFYRAGGVTRAEQYLEDALEANPNNQQAKQLLDQVLRRS
ncbi:MAG: tetratricopeptide repeat protein [Desulfovibrio sp.]|jgi:tetratricopeptide (TPR) repeat protein